MNKRLFILLSMVMALSLMLAACGGGDDDAGDPVAVVKDMMQAVENKNFDNITDFACEADKEEVAQQFDFGAVIAASMSGADIDPQKVLDAMEFEFANAEYEEVSKSGDAAVVRAQGRLNITVNEEKFKELVRELLKAEGLEDVSDELLDQAMGPAMDQFESMGQDIDENFGLIKEDGKWVICESQ
jgi:hypothetical protein